MQDFSYGYDLAGNITTLDERTPNCGVANSPHGRDRLLREFSYDPIYRLLSATGRACAAIGRPRPFDDDPRCGHFGGGAPAGSQTNGPDLTEGYTETYRYDPAGNMLALHYHAPSGQWTRRFGMTGFTPEQWSEKLAAPPGGAPIDWGNEGNRLTNVGGADQAPNHFFDANGNLVRQNSEKHHTWDHADRMVGYRVQPGAGSPPSIQARYLYDAGGMRVKKWVRRGNGGSHDVSAVYIDGLFEQHRWSQDGGGTNNMLHVMDDQSRIAIVRIGPRHPDDAAPRVQYHLGDHLGSSHVVVGGDDASGRAFINREEYFPYGETSFGSFGRKRYRYSGKERDEESGLYYYGAWYSAPWIARWISCDPRSLAAQHARSSTGRTTSDVFVGNGQLVSLFCFLYPNPVAYSDPDGKAVYMVIYARGKENENTFRYGAETKKREIEAQETLDARKDHVFIGEVKDPRRLGRYGGSMDERGRREGLWQDS